MKHSLRRCALTLMLAVLSPTPSTAAAQDLSDARRIAIAERLAESTVEVRVGRSSGSGFLVGPERFVVTNAHVVQGFRRAPVAIRLGERDVRRARVLAVDPEIDLAILEAEGQIRARPLPLADPSSVRVGQTVLAFGSPFGLAGTLTQGIVSARRNLPGSRIEGLIQTDAPINPGNSGGPLANSRGQVIGVNTAILSRSGGSQGIGFAVPIPYVTRLLERVRQAIAERDAVADERPSRESTPLPTEPNDVWIGIVGGEYGGRDGGVQIHQVVPGGPAARAGLRGVRDPPPPLVQRLRIPWTGHIIVAIDGRRVTGMADLKRALHGRDPGDRTTVTVTVGPGMVDGDAILILEPPPRERVSNHPL